VHPFVLLSTVKLLINTGSQINTGVLKQLNGVVRIPAVH